MNTPPQSPLLAVVPGSEHLFASIKAALPELGRPICFNTPLFTPSAVLTAPAADAPGADGPVPAAAAAVFAFEAVLLNE